MMKKRKTILVATVGILGMLVLAGFFLTRNMYSGTSNPTKATTSESSTAFLEQKDLKTYESFDGTLQYEDDVLVITQLEGVLTYLAPEGEELARGAEIYRLYRSSAKSELLSAEQQVSSAEASIAQAELTLENLNSPPTAVQIASAEANIAQAELALENLNSPPTAVQIASADASIAQAEANVAQGEDTLVSMEAGRLIARQSLCELDAADKSEEVYWLCSGNLRAEPFPDNLISRLVNVVSNNLLSAEANNLLIAQKNYEGAIESQKTFEKNLNHALHNRSALDEPPTKAELLQATQALQSAREQRLSLDDPPTEAELLQATQALQSAKEQRLSLDEPPTEAELFQAMQALQSAEASLRTVLENRKDLVEGYSVSLLMFGGVPAWRDMKEGITDDKDISQLKLNLIALGYGTSESLGTDSSFDFNTTAAVMKMQSDLGIIPSGEIGFGEVIFVPGTSVVRTYSTSHTIGQKINNGTELFSLTPIEKAWTRIGSDGAIQIERESLQKVEIQVDVEDLNLVSTGAKVEIELPDESMITGIVSEVGNFAVVPQDGNPFLEVSIAVEASTEYFKWTGANVKINVTKELAKGVLAAPVNGLLALLSGGYALEVVAPTGIVLVPVESGIYADGWVEVNGAGIQPGTEIIVPNQ